MRKALFVGVGVACLLSLASCKKEYQCCWFDEIGELNEDVGVCVTGKYTKRDAEAQKQSVGTNTWVCKEN